MDFRQSTSAQLVASSGHSEGSDSPRVDRTDVMLRGELIGSDGVKNIGTCTSVSALRGVEPGENGQQIILSGYYAKNDGAGAKLYFQR